MKIQSKYLSTLGGIMVVLGCFLPWLAKGSYHVSGWEVISFGRPAWILAISSILAVASFWVRLIWVRMPVLTCMGLVVMANLWRAYRLDALSYGLLVCLLGFGIILWAAIQDSRN